MLRFNQLHRSGPAKLLSQSGGSIKPYIPDQTGGSIEPYIPDQTGGYIKKEKVEKPPKVPKPKKEKAPKKEKTPKPPKPKKEKTPKKVKVSADFSNLAWRKERFPTLDDFQGDANYIDKMKPLLKELIIYLEAQSLPALKEQGISEAVWTGMIDTAKEALEKNDDDDIGNAYDEIISTVNEDYADKVFANPGSAVKVKKEPKKKNPAAQSEDEEEEDDWETPIGKERKKRKPGKPREKMTKEERLTQWWKNVSDEKKEVAAQLSAIMYLINKLKKEMDTKTYYSGIPISDREMLKYPAKIAEKEARFEKIKSDWIEKRKKIYEKVKARYEKMTTIKPDDSKCQEELKACKEENKALKEEVTVLKSTPPTIIQKEPAPQQELLISPPEIKKRRKLEKKLNVLDIKTVPAAPTRKAPLPMNVDIPSKLTLKELKKIAKRNNIPIIANMNREQLFKYVMKQLNKQELEDSTPIEKIMNSLSPLNVSS